MSRLVEWIGDKAYWLAMRLPDAIDWPAWEVFLWSERWLDSHKVKWGGTD